MYGIDSAVPCDGIGSFEKRYVDGKIVDVTYHEPDFMQCFRPGITQDMLEDAVDGLWTERGNITYSEAKEHVLAMPDDLIREYARDYDRMMRADVAFLLLYSGSEDDFFE